MQTEKIKSYPDFELVLTNKKAELGTVYNYLSDEGKKLYDCLKCILFNMSFCESFEEFLEDKEISKVRERYKDIEFIKHMNWFLQKKLPQ